MLDSLSIENMSCNFIEWPSLKTDSFKILEARALTYVDDVTMSLISMIIKSSNRLHEISIYIDKDCDDDEYGIHDKTPLFSIAQAI